ncbi:MAG: antiterminator LoaP [Firmicutes bacterium]|nr:antiterminator LoaP [Bacillota bacterium]
MNWYVAQVMTGKEDGIRKFIQEQGIKCIVPMKRMRELKQGKWQDVLRIIFPGYVFVITETEMDANIYYRIRPIPGVIKLLGDDKGPIPIMENEVNLILRLTQDGDPLGLSEVFVEGSKIIVVSGPLQGLEGRIVKLDARRFRAKVDISFMGEPRCVDLPINVIKKSEV